ncbi:SRPBCC family protein [Humibacillus xanthopallidus]|uniref:SRPBCC family protein n=1 Tax=Humibacillus xanthopallidus TaxID=412689 RepID=UPI0038510FDC
MHHAAQDAVPDAVQESGPPDRARQLTRAGLIGSAAALAAFSAWTFRWTYLHYGATGGEPIETLPGDDLLPSADLVATRAATIGATPDQVWPWVAQLGQGRGGFYSYDRLENLVGCEIESADRIHPEWQDVKVGDPFRLHPKLALVVAEVNPGHSLVVDGRARPGEPAPPYDFTWAFVVRRHPGLRTRLVVRERYGYTTPASRLVVEPLAAGSALMTRKMLHGIRQRVEAARPGGPQPGGWVTS